MGKGKKRLFWFTQAGWEERASFFLAYYKLVVRLMILRSVLWHQHPSHVLLKYWVAMLSGTLLTLEDSGGFKLLKVRNISSQLSFWEIENAGWFDGLVFTIGLNICLLSKLELILVNSDMTKIVYLYLGNCFSSSVWYKGSAYCVFREENGCFLSNPHSQVHLWKRWEGKIVYLHCLWTRTLGAA